MLHLNKVRHLIFAALTVLIIFMPDAGLSAQYIEWEYEVSSEYQTRPSLYWVDEEGNGYYNIKKNTVERPGQFQYGLYLLMLDKYGNLKGTTYVNNCQSTALLLPFGKGKFLASGNNCSPDKKVVRDTRLYDKTGKLLNQTKAFRGNYFARTWSDDGFKFFSKPNSSWGYSFLSIGKISPDFQISYDSIPLAPIEVKGLGMTNNYKDPAQMADKSWVVPINYGIKSGGLSLTNGAIINVKNGQIAWKYPSSLIDKTTQHVSTFEDKVCVVFGAAYSEKYFAILNQEGEELHQFMLSTGGAVKDLILTKEHIILMTKRHFKWYDWKGNFVTEYSFASENITAFGEAKLLDDYSLIFTGYRNGNAVIAKLNFEDKIIELEQNQLKEKAIAKAEKPKKEKHSVTSVSFDNISQKTLSASVFPNPASMFINFQVNPEIVSDSPFQIQVFDVSGRSLHENSFTGFQYELDLSQFVAGTYFYRILLKNEEEIEFISGQFVKIN